MTSTTTKKSKEEVEDIHFCESLYTQPILSTDGPMLTREDFQSFLYSLYLLESSPIKTFQENFENLRKTEFPTRDLFNSFFNDAEKKLKNLFNVDWKTPWISFLKETTNDLSKIPEMEELMKTIAFYNYDTKISRTHLNTKYDLYAVEEKGLKNHFINVLKQYSQHFDSYELLMKLIKSFRTDNYAIPALILRQLFYYPYASFQELRKEVESLYADHKYYSPYIVLTSQYPRLKSDPSIRYLTAFLESCTFLIPVNHDINMFPYRWNTINHSLYFLFPKLNDEHYHIFIRFCEKLFYDENKILTNEISVDNKNQIARWREYLFKEINSPFLPSPIPLSSFADFIKNNTKEQKYNTILGWVQELIYFYRQALFTQIILPFQENKIEKIPEYLKILVNSFYSIHADEFGRIRLTFNAMGGDVPTYSNFISMIYRVQQMWIALYNIQQKAKLLAGTKEWYNIYHFLTQENFAHLLAIRYFLLVKKEYQYPTLIEPLSFTNEEKLNEVKKMPNYLIKNLEKIFSQDLPNIKNLLETKIKMGEEGASEFRSLLHGYLNWQSQNYDDSHYLTNFISILQDDWNEWIDSFLEWQGAYRGILTHQKMTNFPSLSLTNNKMTVKYIIKNIKRYNEIFEKRISIELPITGNGPVGSDTTLASEFLKIFKNYVNSNHSYQQDVVLKEEESLPSRWGNDIFQLLSEYYLPVNYVIYMRSLIEKKYTNIIDQWMNDQLLPILKTKYPEIPGLALIAKNYLQKTLKVYEPLSNNPTYIIILETRHGIMERRWKIEKKLLVSKENLYQDLLTNSKILLALFDDNRITVKEIGKINSLFDQAINTHNQVEIKDLLNIMGDYFNQIKGRTLTSDYLLEDMVNDVNPPPTHPADFLKKHEKSIRDVCIFQFLSLKAINSDDLIEIISRIMIEFFKTGEISLIKPSKKESIEMYKALPKRIISNLLDGITNALVVSSVTLDEKTSNIFILNLEQKIFSPIENFIDKKYKKKWEEKSILSVAVEDFKQTFTILYHNLIRGAAMDMNVLIPYLKEGLEYILKEMKLTSSQQEKLEQMKTSLNLENLKRDQLIKIMKSIYDELFPTQKGIALFEQMMKKSEVSTYAQDIPPLVKLEKEMKTAEHLKKAKQEQEKKEQEKKDVVEKLKKEMNEMITKFIYSKDFDALDETTRAYISLLFPDHVKNLPEPRPEYTPPSITASQALRRLMESLYQKSLQIQKMI